MLQKPFSNYLLGWYTFPSPSHRIEVNFPTQALTATILAEGSQEHSKWAPYLALLPQHLDSLAFWSAPELAELQASAVVHKIGKETAEQMFSEHLSPLGLSNDNSETCHRIASIIMAYAFDIPEKTFPVEPEPEQGGNDEDDLVSDDEGDEKTILSMIPLADMLVCARISFFCSRAHAPSVDLSGTAENICSGTSDSILYDLFAEAS